MPTLNAARRWLMSSQYTVVGFVMNILNLSMRVATIYAKTHLHTHFEPKIWDYPISVLKVFK